MDMTDLVIGLMALGMFVFSLATAVVFIVLGRREARRTRAQWVAVKASHRTHRHRTSNVYRTKI